MSNPPAPRRGRPPSGGREQILAATFGLIQEKGVAKMTTKGIAERAGVSEGSIFYHFKDRAGLLKAVFSDALAPLAEFRREGAGAGDLRATLEMLLSAVERFLDQALVVLFAAQADKELGDELQEYIAEHDLGPHHGVRVIGDFLRLLQARGDIRSDFDVEPAAFMLIGTCVLRVGQAPVMGHSRGAPDRAAVLDTFVRFVSQRPEGARSQDRATPPVT
ncbi:AcrR family transcriptional regulator [Nocardia transvalensis]|uniref:AcrR family transcriptional regulator n=1 Tax=Nocardia transvalensis TaxID=37333 RepID=A0A7W9UMF9_9NOCA|nr:TetR family transcriptional regulator [Nocardia transvalensis]MBB5918332.1 AcrR family transcriptional regulator [Nocardia transvalensis]